MTLTLKYRKIRKLMLSKKRSRDLAEDDPFRYVLVCRRKVSVFSSEEEARQHVDGLIREHGYDPKTRPFKCLNCHQWHIGRPREEQADANGLESNR